MGRCEYNEGYEQRPERTAAFAITKFRLAAFRETHGSPLFQLVCALSGLLDLVKMSALATRRETELAKDERPARRVHERTT